MPAPPTPVSREDRLEALHRRLIEAVDELSTSEGWARMLQAAARFHDYSASNVLLISAQRPDATRVAGIRTWNSLGRRVKRGEHGIAILAPCVYPAPPGDTAQARGARAHESGAVDPEGPPTPAGVERNLRGFRVVHVFDVAQTEGTPLPDASPIPLAGAGPEGLWDRLASLAQADGYRVERGPCRPGAMGCTDFSARVVRVRDEVDGAQAVKTLAHEIGHIRADHLTRFPMYAASRACRGQAEVEAESIAYLLAADAGLDASRYSVPYLCAWQHESHEQLRHTMATVLTVSRSLCDEIRKTVTELNPAERSRDLATQGLLLAPIPAPGV